MKWTAEAPSNIALIKYMGKSTSGKNVGVNPSLSLTLNHLRSMVELERMDGGPDRWESMDNKLVLTETGREKFLRHFHFLKEQFGLLDIAFVVRSKNNFPSDCGIASSASSFAALTKATALAASEITGRSWSTIEQARFSRLGSGSSCRSFFDGFVEWDGEDGITPFSSTRADFVHHVYIVSAGTKQVSSSLAHQRVATSALMQGRVERAQARLRDIKPYLLDPLAHWQTIYQIIWAEFWDMHALFETSAPPFGYMLPGSLEILNAARAEWETAGTGPIVTMDAGPNVHLLWLPSQSDAAFRFKARFSSVQCLTNSGSDT